MRVPPFERYTHLVTGLALFLCGAIIGSALFMGIYQQNFSTLVLTNKNLKDERIQLLSEIESLKKYRHRQNVVGKVVVHFDKATSASDPLSESVQTEIRTRVYNDLKVVIGQSLSAIEANPHIYQNLVHRKTYTNIYEKDYIVIVNTMIASPTQFSVWITTEKSVRN